MFRKRKTDGFPGRGEQRAKKKKPLKEISEKLGPAGLKKKKNGTGGRQVGLTALKTFSGGIKDKGEYKITPRVRTHKGPIDFSEDKERQTVSG